MLYDNFVSSSLLQFISVFIMRQSRDLKDFTKFFRDHIVNIVNFQVDDITHKLRKGIDAFIRGFYKKRETKLKNTAKCKNSVRADQSAPVNVIIISIKLSRNAPKDASQL